jgi:hypothetical protein
MHMQHTCNATSQATPVMQAALAMQPGKQAALAMQPGMRSTKEPSVWKGPFLSAPYQKLADARSRKQEALAMQPDMKWTRQPSIYTAAAGMLCQP